MDKDRIKGSLRQVSGGLKALAGRVFGDKKTEAEGNAEVVAGKIQNAAGGVRDTFRETTGKT